MEFCLRTSRPLTSYFKLPQLILVVITLFFVTNHSFADDIVEPPWDRTDFTLNPTAHAWNFLFQAEFFQHPRLETVVALTPNREPNIQNWGIGFPSEFGLATSLVVYDPAQVERLPGLGPRGGIPDTEFGIFSPNTTVTQIADNAISLAPEMETFAMMMAEPGFDG